MNNYENHIMTKILNSNTVFIDGQCIKNQYALIPYIPFDYTKLSNDNILLEDKQNRVLHLSTNTPMIKRRNRKLKLNKIYE